MKSVLASGFFDSVAVLAVAVATLVYVRWRVNNRDGWVMRRRLPKVTFALLALAVLVTGCFAWRHGRLEDRLSRAASALAGLPVRVHCQDLAGQALDAGNDLGSVQFNADGEPERATLIRREQCSALNGYVAKHGAHPSPAQILAVHVLTHETMHMKGLREESAAECAAVQRDAHLARLLGASAADAQSLAAAYWNQNYPQLSDDYRSGQCHPSGSLDEHLRYGWPGTAAATADRLQ
jgi:hypothetical protein